MKNLNCFIYCLIVYSASFGLSGCSNEEKLSLDGTAEARTPLSISVSNSLETKVGGVVSGSQFGDGTSLGLFLTKEDGSSPYDEPYNNIQYTSSNSGQTWTATTPILLTGTKAKVYASYPYDPNHNDITSIPIDVTQNQDVMWATPYSGAYNANPTATLQMNHALSVIRFSLSKGDYSDAGNITSITIKGDCMAKTGTLNAKTGAVTPTDGGTEIDLGAAATLSSTPTNVEQLVIPTGSGSIQVTIQMDGKTFEATSSAPITPEQSKAYKFGLAFADSKLTMSTVTIVPITEVTVADMMPIVKPLSWSTMTTDNDGVYGIDTDGKPLTYDEASAAPSLNGVAIVMYGRALQISNSGLSSQSWGSTSVNISDIPDVTVVGGGSSDNYGYIAGTSSPQLSKEYTTWINTQNTALADTCGWSNTEALIKAQGNRYLGGATTTFRENSSVNHGYSDWFIPSAGQLVYMFLNMTAINTLLAKCSNPAGTALPSNAYWSSAEYSTNYAWGVGFDDGYVGYRSKNHGYCSVRFCRDITE